MWKSDICGNNDPGLEEQGIRRLLASVEETLREKLPRNWSVILTSQLGDAAALARAASRPDAMLAIEAPDRTRATLAVEAKRRLEPKLVPVVADQLARYAQGKAELAGMVVAPFLSPFARERLIEAGLSYADATGNLRLALERPALYIETSGASSDPWAKSRERPLRSLKGPTAGRVVRALCDFRPPYGVEQLARRSGTSLGSVSRVFALLDAEGIITRDPRGPVTEVDWLRLIHRWVEDYGFARTNTTWAFLEPRGLPALLEKLKRTQLRYALTGSLAAAEIAPVAASRLASVYVGDAGRAAMEFQLRPAETGANVVLAEPFDRVAFERTWERDGLTYAALSQMAADLLTGPGRGPAEGEELLRWMREHEDVWRT